jgi:hypothetical protein
MNLSARSGNAVQTSACSLGSFLFGEDKIPGGVGILFLIEGKDPHRTGSPACVGKCQVRTLTLIGPERTGRRIGFSRRANFTRRVKKSYPARRVRIF